MCIKAYREHFKAFFDRYGVHCACLAAFLIPLKLFAAYVVIIPLLCAWIFARGAKALRAPLYTPLLFFIAAAAFSALFGINALRSFRGLLSLAFFSLTIGFWAEVFSSPRGVYALFSALLAQGLAGISGVFQSAFPQLFPRLFLGRIAESGQMSLTLILALGLLLLLCNGVSDSPWKLSPPPQSCPAPIIGAGILQALLLVALGFAASFAPLSPYRIPLFAVTGIGACSCIVTSFALWRKGNVVSALRLPLWTLIVPGMLGGILVNLKRGPWLGVAVAASILLLRYEKKVVLPLIAAAALAATLITPVRTRLAQSSQDFFIHGGRNVLWQIGAELAPRYPLGIGYKNSRALRDFSEQVPPEHTHFHNNALNILVETGWIAALAFVWWIIKIVRTGFSSPFSAGILGPTVACAVLSWQIAGIFEYNAGDSEVLLVVYMAVGLLTALAAPQSASSSSQMSAANGN